MTTYLADDVADIAKRMREIAQQESPPSLNEASGETLDWHGRRASIDRNPGESDFAYRIRIAASQA